MMKKQSGNSVIIREAILLIGILALVTLICRLWALLLLMLLSLFAALIVLLFRATKPTEIIETQPMPLPISQMPQRVATQKDVFNLAYSVILRRITELVHEQYPQARWVWELSNAKQRIENGEDVFILLNRAGGYNRALVVIKNLQIKQIIFNPVKTEEPTDSTVDEGFAEELDEDLPENYELIAFEWVEAHIIALNERCNEAIGTGKTKLLIEADELPVKESWVDVCKQLKKAEIENLECVPEGIQIYLTH